MKTMIRDPYYLFETKNLASHSHCTHSITPLPFRGGVRVGFFTKANFTFQIHNQSIIIILNHSSKKFNSLNTAQ